MNYVPGKAPDPAVRKATKAIVDRMMNGKVRDFAYVFDVLMNPFRAKVVAAVAKAGAIPALEICEKLEHQAKHLRRDLQCALDAGLLTVDDSDVGCAVYRYVAPSDPLVELLVSLAR